MTDTNIPAASPQPVPDQTRAVAPIELFRQTLTAMKSGFADALPKQIPAEKFVRTVMTSVQMQPDLLGADRRSLFGAAMKAAQDGLLPDGRESAFVIFNTKAGPQVQYMPMIGGLLKKLRNSGELASIAAHVAYENDEFVYELGDEEKIVHRPLMTGDRGAVVAVYAIAKTRDGAIYRDVMSYTEVEQVRAVSRARNSGPWTQWWNEMAKKTVIRRLCKRLPSSADLEQLFAHDNESTDFSQQDAPKASATAPLSRLKTSMGLTVEVADQAPEISVVQQPPEEGGE